MLFMKLVFKAVIFDANIALHFLHPGILLESVCNQNLRDVKFLSNILCLIQV